MADLSWVRELGAQRRAALERDAREDPAAARHLVSAMFDGLINHLWYRLSTDVKETVDAYNAGGSFSDLSLSATHDRVIVQRRHHPAFVIDLQLDHASRQLQITIQDGDEPATSEPLPVVFVEDELWLWHAGQTESGYQLAKRVLKSRL